MKNENKNSNSMDDLINALNLWGSEQFDFEYDPDLDQIIMSCGTHMIVCGERMDHVIGEYECVSEYLHTIMSNPADGYMDDWYTFYLRVGIDDAIEKIKSWPCVDDLIIKYEWTGLMCGCDVYTWIDWDGHTYYAHIDTVSYMSDDDENHEIVAISGHVDGAQATGSSYHDTPSYAAFRRAAAQHGYTECGYDADQFCDDDLDILRRADILFSRE